MSVTAVISAALERIGDEFEANDLACTLMRSKSERRLCDALAACLRDALANEPDTLVSREWGHGEPCRRRVDLAVCRGGVPLALIEAKVARTFDLAVKTERRYPSEPILCDIKKLQSMEFDTERYAVLFVTHNHETPEVGHDEAIPYVKEMRGYGVIDQDVIDNGLDRVQQVFESEVASCVRGRVTAGKAFGVDVTLFYRLYSIR